MWLIAILPFLLTAFKINTNTQNLPNREVHNLCQGGAKSPVETALREACWDHTSGCSYYLLWSPVSKQSKEIFMCTSPTGRWRRRWPASPSPQTTSQPGLPIILAAGGSGSLRGGSGSTKEVVVVSEVVVVVSDVVVVLLEVVVVEAVLLKRWSRSSLWHHLLHSLATSTDTPWRNWWE